MSFLDGMIREVENVQRQAERRVKQVATKAFQEISDSSPVDKGTFRANWNVSIDSIDRSADLDKTIEDVAANVTKATAVLAGQELLGKTVYISNSVPYANKIENGYSPQAPAGVVAPAVTRITNAVESGQS